MVLTEREDGLPHLRIVDLTAQAGSALAGIAEIELCGARVQRDAGNQSRIRHGDCAI